MAGPVHIFDTVNQEPQGKPPILDRLAFVLDDESELVDLVDHAAHLRIVAGELGVVLGLVEGDIDIVPRSGLGEPAPVLIGPQ
jgi:hypothetical protein